MPIFGVGKVLMAIEGMNDPDPEEVPIAGQNPMGQFEGDLRLVLNRALERGLSPLLVIGLLDCLKTDLRDSMVQRVREAKRHEIIRASGLPNGHG